jgi:hypothetical protein
MSEKQLNFLNIFETSKKEEASSSESEYLVKNGENDYEDPLVFDLEEKRLREEAELISRKEREKNELELKRSQRQRLLDSHSPRHPSDFQSVLPEIQQYAERSRSYRAVYESSSPEQKSELYPRLVWPDTYEEPEYRESARLYINYLEAVKREREEQSENKMKSSFSKKKKEKKTLTPTKKQEKVIIRRSLVEADAQEDDDAPNPYGDIYPYSRNWRSK